MTKGQSEFLAPFYDRNGDDYYDWQEGDYPYYDFDRSNTLCKAELPTLESIYGISNGGILADQMKQRPFGQDVVVRKEARSRLDKEGRQHGHDRPGAGS